MATGRYSTFPTVIDKLKLLPELKDMTVEQVGKIARYNELIIKGKNGTLTSAEQLELDGLHQEMKTYNLSPTDWNTVISAMINIEKYLNDTILPEIGTMVDNAELQINTSVTNGVSVVDNKVNSVIPQIDKYVSDLINNNANVVSVGHLRNQFIITSETNKVAIGIHGFNVNTDVLTLTVSGTQYYQYQNGSGDYTIDSATNVITLVGDKKFYVDEIVLIEIVKNVMKNVPIMDVSLLADDSIMRVKLDQDTQDILNHMERVVDNQSFTVPSTAWVGTEPNLTYQIVHNMNNKNLIVGVVDTDTQKSKLPDFKYIDMNTIEMQSVSRDNITVVINANGYSGSDGNIVSQEVIDARKGEVSLKSKIDGIDSQLADIPQQDYITEKATKSYVDTITQSLASGSPKGTFATLLDLQTAYPTGTTGIYVVTADGKWYYWNGSAWVSGGVYQSTGIADGAITDDKIADNSKIAFKKSKNLLNENTLITGYFVNYLTGNLTVNNSYSASEFIQILSNTDYVLSNQYSVSSSVEQLAFYDSNKIFISGISNSGTSISVTFKSPSNAKYIRLSVKNQYIGYMQFEPGTLYTPYEKYSLAIKLEDIERGEQLQEVVEKHKKTLTVKQDGTGDFITLKNAINSISDNSEINIYEIQIYEGVYNILSDYTQTEIDNISFIGLKIPNYVNLKGIGDKTKIILNGELPSNALPSNINRISTINIMGNSDLENVTVKGTNLRYAVHDDYSAINLKRNVNNCEFYKYGVGYQQAYGGGTCSGSEYSFKDCYFYSDNNGVPFSFHNNVNFTKPSKIKVVNSNFENKLGTTAIRFGSMGSGQDDEVELIGCRLMGNIKLFEEQSNGVGIDFNLKGYGNDTVPVDFVTTDGLTYTYDFVGETKKMMNGEPTTITKGTLVRLNSTGSAIHTFSASHTFGNYFGITMEDIAPSTFGMIRIGGYLKVADTSLTGLVIGDKIGIVNGALAKVTTGDFIGVVKMTGWIKLI